jgi:hypothetical protein
MNITNKSWNKSATDLKDAVREKLINQAEIPYKLWNTIRSKCILSGSCISSIYHGEEPNDYDFWLREPNSIQWLRDIIIRDYPDYIMDVSEKYGNLPNTSPLITENAITLKNNFQIIALGDYFTERKKFDYVHCLPYVNLADSLFYISEYQFKIIDSKILVKNPDGKEPTSMRTQKFLDRGWKLDTDYEPAGIDVF